MKSPAKKGWELTGAVTFYKSDVEINNCYFGQIQSEDALNIIRSRFSLENSVFEETVSDAYDSDFSNGRIMNCRFSNIGNDGIDGSGSVMQINNVIVKKCGDKAISGGEESKFVIKSLLVDEANVAIASKDGSDILVSKVDINNCKYGFTVFRKKTEFDFAQLDLYLLRSRNVQNLFLVEEMSVARRDGVYLEANSKNLKTLLYP